jgi:MFS family permease
MLPAPMSDAAPPISETRALLSQRPYMLFLAGRFIATLGVQVQATTIAWQIYALARQTGSSINEASFTLSMIGLIQFLPVLILTLPAGQVADHHNRRNIMIISLLADLVSTVVLAVLGFVNPIIWPIFLIAAAFGCSRAFTSPAGGALAPMLVPRELMPRALAWNSLSWQVGTIAGPVVGGAVLALASHFGHEHEAPGWAYLASAVLYVGAVATLFLIRANTTPERQSGSRWEMMKEGLAYVWTNKIVLGAISLDLFAVILGGATLLLPAFAADVLKVGPEGYGLLRAAPGAGAALVAFYLASHPVKKNAGRIMFTGVFIFGAATVVFGLSKFMWLSVAALALLGGADMVSVYVRQTLVQIVTPDHMRGRVASVSGLFIGASNELGEFESGLVARFLGPVGAAVFGGVGAMIVTGTWAKLFPDLRKADRLA